MQSSVHHEPRNTCLLKPCEAKEQFDSTLLRLKCPPTPSPSTPPNPQVGLANQAFPHLSATSQAFRTLMAATGRLAALGVALAHTVLSRRVLDSGGRGGEAMVRFHELDRWIQMDPTDCIQEKRKILKFGKGTGQNTLAVILFASLKVSKSAFFLMEFGH